MKFQADVLTLAAIVALAACGSSGRSASTASSPTPMSTGPDANTSTDPNYYSVTKMIVASQGGTLTLSDGAVLTVPPNALPSDQAITLTMASDQTAASVDHWYEVTPSMVLSSPATLTAPVTAGGKYVVVNSSTENPLL